MITGDITICNINKNQIYSKNGKGEYNLSDEAQIELIKSKDVFEKLRSNFI